MLKSLARLAGAIAVGALLAWPAAAQKSNNTGPATNSAPPVTAPTKDAGKVPQEPSSTVQAVKEGKPPVPVQGSTAVPGWNVPPSFAPTSERPQYASIPGVDRNILIQGEGREWRQFRNGPLTRFGGWIIVGVLALILVFYLIKGAIKLHGQPTGRLIERFNAVERASHWVVAISFVFLAVSGIVILWGKHLILPWLCYTGFSWLTIVSKNIHNFVGPLFIFALLVMFLLYVRDNLWRSHDTRWLTHLGGMFGKGGEIPSGRFNAGEKGWFWVGVVILGITMSVTGLILDFPNWDQGRQAMQTANVVHAIGAVIFISLSFGHIYLGTIGMEGAYRGMRDGYVDEEWAREHHALWYDDVRQGKRPERIVGATAQPAPGDD